MLKLGFLSLCESVNCEAFHGEILECGESDEISLFFSCKFLLFDIGVCGANGLINFEFGEFFLDCCVFSVMLMVYVQ